MDLLVTIALILCCSTGWLAPYRLAHASDAAPLQDFCVADTSYANSQVTLNGFPCKPAAHVQSTDFKSILLEQPAQTNQALGVAVNLASAATFPALNTQGLSVARIDFQPQGLNPPHVHPRATEVLFLAQGTLVVGFVSSTPENTLFQQTLYKGDLFVFPRGLVHFQLNPDKNQPALAISALNSQNPGVSQVAAAVLAAQPSLPQQVLLTTLAVDEAELDSLVYSVATTV